jgi:hypothetical protein
MENPTLTKEEKFTQEVLRSYVKENYFEEKMKKRPIEQS